MQKLLLLFVLSGSFLTAFGQLTTQQWQADIAFLKKELPARHPNFYQRISPEAWSKTLDNIAAEAERKADLRIALELQTLVARAADARTRLDFVQLLQTNKVIPMAFSVYEDGLFVSATVQKFEEVLGKKILAINGLPPEEVLQKLDIFVGSENSAGLRRDAPLWLRFPMAFRLAGVSNNDTLALTLDNPAGDPLTSYVYPPDMRKASRTDMMPAQLVAQNPDLRWQPVSIGDLYKFAWLEEHQIFFLQYNYCLSQEMAEAQGDTDNAGRLPAFQPVVDTLVKTLHAHPEARLFLDLRFNRGGLPNDGISLAKLLGADRDLNLPGRLYVAINGYTSPVPARIAQAFRDHTQALLIGEPTGEKPVYSGDEDKFQLPNSKVFVIHPKNLLLSSPQVPDALYPDVNVPLRFSDFRDGRDPVLDYVRNLKNNK